MPSTGSLEGSRGAPVEISSLTINRLSLYLQCLRQLQAQGLKRISSKELAQRFTLSAPQIRKDLAAFGEFGIRGVGYDIDELAARLTKLLGLERKRLIVIVGVGNLGSALARYLGFNSESFQVVAGVDSSPAVIGRKFGTFVVRPSAELAQVVRATGAEIGVLTVPPEAAQENYEALVRAGILGVVNFTLTRLRPHPDVPVKEVDLRLQLEELAFHLPR
jgi:redox-sensing transcriptional repressor